MAKFLYSRVHHKPNNKLAIAIVSVIGVVVLAVFIFLYFYIQKTPRDMIVDRYIEGLRTRRVTELYSILAPEYDGKNLELDMKKYGGLLFAINIGYTPSETNGMETIAHIRGMKGFSTFKKDITLIGTGSAWYLIDGDLKDEYKR